MLSRVKQQQAHMQSQNSTLASFTPQQASYPSTTGIQPDDGCSKNLSPCCSSSKKDNDNRIYKKPIDLSHIV